MGDWCARVRPSYAIPVAGLMAVFGAMVGAGPVSEATGCCTFGIGMGSCHGLVAGLAQLPHPLLPERQLPLPQVPAQALELRPILSISIPLLESRPIRIRSRRLKPALINSCRFLKASYMAFQRARDTRSPFALKYKETSLDAQRSAVRSLSGCKFFAKNL